MQHGKTRHDPITHNLFILFMLSFSLCENLQFDKMSSSNFRLFMSLLRMRMTIQVKHVKAMMVMKIV